VTRIKVYLSTELVFENKLCSTECTNKVIKRHATPEPETLINEFQKSWTNWMRDFLYFLDADLAEEKKKMVPFISDTITTITEKDFYSLI
jgi:hypothetical protein